MKRLISTHSLAWIVAIAGACAVLPAWAADLKIGVVDYGKLMEESPQAKVVVEAIRTEFTPRQRDLQTQQTTLKAKEDKLQKDGATMTEDQRQRSEKELRDSYRDLQRTLIEEVRVYAKAQNFDLVVADGVIYSTPSLDITPAILTALQSHAPAAGKTAAPAASKPKGQ